MTNTLPAQVAPGLLLLLLLLCVSTPVSAVDSPLRGEWRAVGADDAAWQPFDPARLNRFPRQPHGVELRLWAEPPAAIGADTLLVVSKPALERVTWRAPDRSITAHLLDVERRGWHGHGRIGFELPAAAAQPLHLRLEPQPRISGAIAFDLQARERFLADDARWVALVSTCLAVLGGMALMALVFTVRLRDIAFLHYAGYLVSYAMIQLIQTGYVASPLGWQGVADASLAVGRAAVVISVLMAVLFLIRFAALRLYLPRATRLLQAYAALVAVNALLGLLPSESVQGLSRALVNPLLILGGPLLLVVSVIAWVRGSRYAGFFAIGWTPLLLLTVAGSMQLYGWWPDWRWSGEAALVAAAFEAMVLSAGLADRSAAMRRDRDVARALADVDPLTGVLNRRALQRRLDELGSHAGRGGAPLAVLFCDLDHFKLLNDSLGHAAGDTALRAVADELSRELRTRDAIGRYGGEEFVLLLPGCDLDAAAGIADRLRRGVEELGQPPRFGERPLTISIGVCVQLPGEDVSDTLQRADAAMYAAKRGGRNRVEVDGAGSAAGRVS